MKIEASGYGSAMQTAMQQRQPELRIGGEELGTPDAPKTVETVQGPSFGDVLANTAMAASDKDREAAAKATALADGKSDDLHGTMITMKEADISIKLVGTVRDRLMDAFHELWRINV